MASYLITHIEYKKDAKWHLLKIYGPHQKRTSTVNVDGKWVTKEVKPDVITEDGVELDCTTSEWHQGVIRDLFMDSYNMEENPYARRGLPKDLSDELNAEYTEMNAKAEENAKGGYSGKYWYAESYCTLSELNHMAASKIEAFKTNVEKTTDLTFHDTINKKLDAVLDLLKNRPIITRNEDSEYVDSLAYLWNEEFYDILNLSAYINHIMDLVNTFTGIYNTEDMRIVVHIE